MKLDIQMFADGTVTIGTKLDTKDFEKGLDKIQGSSQKAGSTIKNIVAGLGIAKVVSKGMQLITSSIDDAVKRVDTLNNFPKVMSNLGVSTKEADKAINKMSDKLSGLPTTLDQGAMAVQRFTSANGDVAKSTDIFLALNNAILAGGASTDIQATALEQLSQAYAKGKPDMMEWRSIQTAMPAQLKQVATAMGYAGGNVAALGEDLRKGNVSMDDFIDTIVKLNKKGVDGFQSFEKQARNSTAGIGTAITVAKTQVVKGVASIVDGLNTGLKKSGTSISKIIANIGKEFKKHLDNIGKMLSKIKWSDVFDKTAKAMKVLVPILASVVAGIAAYNAVVKIAAAINFAKSLTAAISAMMGLTKATELASAAQKIYNILVSLNPAGILIAAVVGLTAAFIAFGAGTRQVDKDIKKTDETLKNYKETMKEIQKEKEKTLSKNMNELYYYQSLADELKNITDENGKVKQGYEDRAKVITGELSKALDMEIEMTDGVVKNYQEIQSEIDKTIEKKKAMAYFNANEEEYNQALKDEATLQKEVTKNASKRKKALDKINTAFDEEAKKTKGLSQHKEELLKYYKGEILWIKLSLEARKAHNKMSDETRNTIRKETDAYVEYDERVKKATKTYADNQVIIDKTRRAQQALAEGNYEAVQKIFVDTVTFNGKTAEANNKLFENGKTGWEAYRQFLKDNQSKYSQEFLDSEYARIDKEISLLNEEKEAANKKIQEKNDKVLNTTITGLNDQLKVLGDKKYEFRKTADGNMQLYVDGIAQKIPVTKREAQNIVNNVISQLKSGKISAEEAGNMLMQGLENGIRARSVVTGSVAFAVSKNVLAQMQAGLQENSPSKATKKMGQFLMQGLNIGIDKEKRNIYKNIDEISGEILNKMNNAVNIQTEKMTSNIQTSGTYQVAMSGNPTFNLQDNSTNQTQLVVNGKVLAEVVNAENRSREVAKA